MKKIMFSDKYGLTQAVIEGYKTKTRRILNLSEADEEYLNQAFDWDLRESVILDRYAKYKVGEVVAVAQPYCATNVTTPTQEEILNGESFHWFSTSEPAWTNKMFVKADRMPYRIRITDRKVCRLQDITWEDCLREGIIDETTPVIYLTGNHMYTYKGIEEGAWFGKRRGFLTPVLAFESLIDKINGNGTWDRNPWSIAYSFQIERRPQ